MGVSGHKEKTPWGHLIHPRFDNLIYKNVLKYADNLKYEDDLRYEDTLNLKTTWNMKTTSNMNTTSNMKTISNIKTTSFASNQNKSSKLNLLKQNNQTCQNRWYKFALSLAQLSPSLFYSTSVFFDQCQNNSISLFLGYEVTQYKTTGILMWKYSGDPFWKEELLVIIKSHNQNTY